MSAPSDESNDLPKPENNKTSQDKTEKEQPLIVKVSGLRCKKGIQQARVEYEGREGGHWVQVTDVDPALVEQYRQYSAEQKEIVKKERSEKEKTPRIKKVIGMIPKDGDFEFLIQYYHDTRTFTVSRSFLHQFDPRSLIKFYEAHVRPQ